MEPTNDSKPGATDVLAYNGLKRKLTHEEDRRARKVVAQFRLLSFASVLLVVTLVASAFLTERERAFDAHAMVARFSALLIPLAIVYLTAKTKRAYRERPFAILEIDEKTITFSISISQISLPWRAVRKVARKERNIEIRAKGDRLMLIPTNLFKNLKEADRFVQAANAYVEQVAKR